MRCAVSKCKQSNSRRSTDEKPVHFYSFPKHPERRKLWVLFCNRSNAINTDNERICSLHFKQEDFERNLKFEMGFSSRCAPKLKPQTIPSVETNAFANELEINHCNAEVNPPMATLPIKTEMETLSCDEENNLMATDYIKCENETLTYTEVNATPLVTTDASIKFETDVFPGDEKESSITTDNKDDIPGDEEESNMTTDNNDDSQEQKIKNLEMKIDALREENNMLKELQIKSANKVKKLSGFVRNLNWTNANFEKALAGLFTEGQIKRIKNGDYKRKTFSESEIAQSMKLYLTSSKAYNLLKDNNFPLPSVSTLQRWSRKQDSEYSVKNIWQQ